MLQIIAIVVCLAATVATAYLVIKAVRSMLAVIKIGTPISRVDQPLARTLTMLKETVLHTRMLQWTWVGVLHWFAFAAFLLLSTAVGAAYFQLFDPEWTLPVIGKLFAWAAAGCGFAAGLAAGFGAGLGFSPRSSCSALRWWSARLSSRAALFKSSIARALRSRSCRSASSAGSSLKILIVRNSA